MEKYPAEILASQPTIGTESQDKLHGLSTPAPKYVVSGANEVSTKKDLTSNEARRDGTRLLIMSENTTRSMNIVEEERTTVQNISPAKQVVELGQLGNSIMGDDKKSPSGTKLAGSGTTLLNRDHKNQQSGGQVMQPAPTINVLDVFNIKGQQKNLQVRGQPSNQVTSPGQ